jgi:hypothetical protein
MIACPYRKRRCRRVKDTWSKRLIVAGSTADATREGG